MAKFHVGDIVKDTSYPLSGKFKIVQVNNDGTYAIQPLRGGATSVEKENFLVAANAEEDAVAYDADDPECPSTNPVVQNAMRLRVRNSRVVRNDKYSDAVAGMDDAKEKTGHAIQLLKDAIGGVGKACTFYASVGDEPHRKGCAGLINTIRNVIAELDVNHKNAFYVAKD